MSSRLVVLAALALLTSCADRPPAATPIPTASPDPTPNPNPNPDPNPNPNPDPNRKPNPNPNPDPNPSPDPNPNPNPDPNPDPSPDAALDPAAALTDPLVAVDDPAALAILAAAGADAPTLLAGALPALRTLVHAEVAHELATDPHAGIGIRGHPHRLFDPTWLDDPRGLALVGVVYRVDLTGGGRCGDVRFLYRLGYDRAVGTGRLASRVPLTLAAVVPFADDLACPDRAATWRPPRGATGAVLGAWLRDHPLRDSLRHTAVAQVLVNFQLTRWPAVVHPTLGGHAEYVLATLGRDPHAAAAWAVVPSAATPDVDRIAADPAARAALVAWARDRATIADANRGVVALPAALSATTVRAVTPGGLHRRHNRPFSRLLMLADLDGLAFAGTEPVTRSPAAYLRRLDELTCSGCHASRAIAGFHWLGVDPPGITPGDGLAVHQSPHVLAELARRADLARLVAAGHAITSSRPFADQPATPGRLGDHCGLGDEAFASWTCGPGLTCARGEAGPRDPVGVCLHDGPALVGGACDIGPIRAGRTARDDRMPARGPERCAAGLVCDRRKIGLPGGLCIDDCAAADTPAGPGQTCGRIGANDFNQCLLRATFASCLATHTRPVSLAACSPATPCRDDYICAASPAGPACVPPYFLFQLRVDGHPPAL